MHIRAAFEEGACGAIAYGILTKELGDAFYQGARVYRQDTAELLLKLGATSLKDSGVVPVEQREQISVGR